jgi:hypothetical protein
LQSVLPPTHHHQEVNTAVPIFFLSRFPLFARCCSLSRQRTVDGMGLFFLIFSVSCYTGPQRMYQSPHVMSFLLPFEALAGFRRKSNFHPFSLDSISFQGSEGEECMERGYKRMYEYHSYIRRTALPGAVFVEAFYPAHCEPVPVPLFFFFCSLKRRVMKESKQKSRNHHFVCVFQFTCHVWKWFFRDRRCLVAYG